jgi:methionyl aminopeptidase
LPKDRLADLGGAAAPATPEPRPDAVRKGRVSPMRSVPPHIVRPDYAASGRPAGRGGRQTPRTPEQIERMRRACRVACEVLATAAAAVRPGITTDAIDQIAHEAYIARGAYPSTLNYHHYPKSICSSVNEVICHGIPDDRPLVEGDIVNLDITAYIEGMHGDCSATFAVGCIDDESQRLVTCARTCLERAIAAVRPGGRLNAIGAAIEEHARSQGFGVVRAFVGHGIGELFHMDPQVPHYFDPAARTVLVPGMTFTIEPMINQGTWQHVSWDDNWTAVTADGKRSAQFEHTILVTETGVEILTA